MENSYPCVLDKQVNNLDSAHYNMDTQSLTNGLEILHACSVHIVILMSEYIFTPLFQWLARDVLRNLTPPQIHESTK